MQILSVTPDREIEGQEPAAEQMLSWYYLPRYPDAMDLDYTLHLQDIGSKSFYTKIRAQQPGKLLCRFFLAEDNQERLLIEIETNNSYPVHGSASLQPIEVLAVTFQKYHDGAFYYTSYLLYPMQQQTLHRLGGTEHRNICQISPGRRKKLQVHIIGAMVMGKRNVKLSKQVVYERQQCLVRVLVLLEGGSVQEQNMYVDDYKPVQSALEQKQVVDFINARFAQQLTFISNFCDMSYSARLVAEYVSPGMHGRVIYIHYNRTFNELVLALNEVSNATRMLPVVQVYVFHALQEKRPCFRKLAQFNAPVICLQPGRRIGCFDGQLIDQNMCTIQYFALSAINSVLTYTYCARGRVHLDVFHVQTGSSLRVSAESQLGFLDISGAVAGNMCGICDEAARVVQILSKNQNITKDEEDRYMYLYQQLFLRQQLVKQQPCIIIQNYSLVWMVPNVRANKNTVYLIKVLPFIPIELITVQKMELISSDNYLKIVDFINGDEELQGIRKQLQSLQDYERNTQVNVPNYFKFDRQFLAAQIQNNQVRRNFSILNSDSLDSSENKNPSSASTGNQVIKQFSPQFTQTDDYIENSNQAMQLASSPLTSGKCPSTASCKILPQHQLVFQTIYNVPTFTNQELTFQACQRDYTNVHEYVGYNNYFCMITPIKQIYQESNNILIQIEFHRLINGVLQQYEKSNLMQYYDITQFAINQILFSSRIYSGTAQQYFTVSVHPIKIIQTLKQSAMSKDGLNRYATYIKYISDMLMQVSQIQKVQIGEFIIILKSIFGQSFKDFIDRVTKESGEYLFEEINYKLFEDLISGPQLQLDENINQLLTISILKLSHTITRYLQSANTSIAAAMDQSFEMFMADYIYFHNIFNRYVKQKDCVFRSIQNPTFTDYSGHHLLAKMYNNTLSVSQFILSSYLEGDSQFLTAIQQTSPAAIRGISQLFEQLQYYCIFSKSLNTIINAINAYMTKPSEARHILNEVTPGDVLLLNISRILNQEAQRYNEIFTNKSSYRYIHEISQECLVLLAQDIIEQHVIKPCYDRLWLSHTEQNVRYPDWLQYLVNWSFEHSGLDDQVVLPGSDNYYYDIEYLYTFNLPYQTRQKELICSDNVILSNFTNFDVQSTNYNHPAIQIMHSMYRMIPNMLSTFSINKSLVQHFYQIELLEQLQRMQMMVNDVSICQDRELSNKMYNQICTTNKIQLFTSRKIYALNLPHIKYMCIPTVGRGCIHEDAGLRPAAIDQLRSLDVVAIYRANCTVKEIMDQIAEQ